MTRISNMGTGGKGGGGGGGGTWGSITGTLSNQTDLQNALNAKLSSYTRAATLVVAASNSKDTTDADYVCTGTNDHTTINTAIGALPTGGGKILLMEGTYNLGGTINISRSDVLLEGQGTGTIIKLANSKNVDLILLGHASITYQNIFIRNIYFDGNGANQTGGSIIDNSDNSFTPVNNLIIEGCYFTNAYNCAVYNGGSPFFISYCWFVNNIGTTLHATIYDDFGDGICTNCYFTENSTTISSALFFQEISNSFFSIPSGHNTKVIDTVDKVIGNRIAITTAAASSIAIANGYVISNNNIRYFGTPANTSSIAISDGRNITDNYIDSPGIGIKMTVNNMIIGSNNIAGPKAYGIYVTGNYNTISSNEITSAAFDGIRVTGTDNSISLNTITSPTSYGIYTNSDKNLINDNIVTSPGIDGIDSDGSTYVIIKGNYIENPVHSGIKCNSFYQTVSGNMVLITNNPTDAAIGILGGDHGVINDNIIRVTTGNTAIVTGIKSEAFIGVTGNHLYFDTAYAHVGILTGAFADQLISSNVLENNNPVSNSIGISVTTVNCSITGNHLLGWDNAVKLSGGGYNNINGNNIDCNGGTNGVIEATSSDGPNVITGNIIINATTKISVLHAKTLTSGNLANTSDYKSNSVLTDQVFS